MVDTERIVRDVQQMSIPDSNDLLQEAITQAEERGAQQAIDHIADMVDPSDDWCGLRESITREIQSKHIRSVTPEDVLSDGDDG